MCFWSLTGKNLQYQVGELTVPKAFTNIGTGVFTINPANQGKFGLSLVSDKFYGNIEEKDKKNRDKDLENIYVTFLSI